MLMVTPHGGQPHDEATLQSMTSQAIANWSCSTRGSGRHHVDATAPLRPVVQHQGSPGIGGDNKRAPNTPPRRMVLDSFVVIESPPRAVHRLRTVAWHTTHGYQNATAFCHRV